MAESTAAIAKGISRRSRFGSEARSPRSSSATRLDHREGHFGFDASQRLRRLCLQLVEDGAEVATVRALAVDDLPSRLGRLFRGDSRILRHQVVLKVLPLL